MKEDQQLANKRTVEQLVAAYTSANAKIEQGYALLAEAQLELCNAFGEHYGDFDTVDPHNHYGVIGIKKSVKRGAWKAIINRLEIRKLLSTKRADELDKQLENSGAMPEINDAAIFDIMTGLLNQSGDFAKEAVKEVFDFLRPGASDNQHSKRYVTNQKNGRFEIGKKVILGYMVENNFSRGNGMRVRYGCDNRLRALDRVFHLLDGKGVPEGYMSPLIDAINTGLSETDYFEFQVYQNMNLHIKFKRMDLVDKLNQIAGGMTLREARP